MEYKFEEFSGAGKKLSPTVSIRSNGVFGLSQGLLHRSGISDDRWRARFFFDKEASVIGIKPVHDDADEQHAKIIFRPSKTEKGTEVLSAFISAKPFFYYYNIPFNSTRTFAAEWDAESGFIIVNLSKEISRRNKKTSTEQEQNS